MVIWGFLENQANGIGYFGPGSGWVGGGGSSSSFDVCTQWTGCCLLLCVCESCTGCHYVYMLVVCAIVPPRLARFAPSRWTRWPRRRRGSGSESENLAAGSDIVVFLCASVMFSVSISASHWKGCCQSMHPPNLHPSVPTPPPSLTCVLSLLPIELRHGTSPRSTQTHTGSQFTPLWPVVDRQLFSSLVRLSLWVPPCCSC